MQYSLWFHFAPFQHAFVHRLSELGIAYGGSPIVEGSAKRYFVDSIRGGEGIKSRFLLMIANDQKSSLADVASGLGKSFGDILELDGKGHFPVCQPLPTESVTSIVAADFDGDGALDLFVPHRDGGQSIVLWNDGKGTFRPRPT